MARGNQAPPRGTSQWQRACNPLGRSQAALSLPVSRFVITLLPEAEAEMRDAFLWYFERNVLIADGFRLEVSGAIDGLEDTAADWPKDGDGVHFYHLKHFPYTVWYEIEGTKVTVLAVAHQRREPRYWDTR